MSSQMTIYDISKKAGVSIATVSRVLNGSTKVKESTRKKIMDIIKDERERELSLWQPLKRR